MKGNISKFLSLLLITAMLFGMIPLSVMAEHGGYISVAENMIMESDNTC